MRVDDSSPRRAFVSGVQGVAPILLGVIPFGMIYGVLAIGAGLTPLAAQAMSCIVFAGSAQFVAAQLFRVGAPGVVIVLTTLIINLRHVLYSASVAPYLSHLSWRWKALLAYLLTDEAYAVVITHYLSLPPQPPNPGGSGDTPAPIPFAVTDSPPTIGGSGGAAPRLVVGLDSPPSIGGSGGAAPRLAVALDSPPSIGGLGAPPPSIGGLGASPPRLGGLGASPPSIGGVGGKNSHWHFLGAGLGLWSSWQLSTAAGIVLGAQIPAGWALDFTLALTFIALVVPTLKDRPSVAAALAAGLVAVATVAWPYKLGLMAAALTGILVGLWADTRRQEAAR